MSRVSTHNLVVTHGNYPAVADASFQLPEKHFCVVTGENGSGKTTLLKALSGTVLPARGEVRVDTPSGTVTSSQPRLLRSVISYCGHNAVFMRHVNVREHLELCVSFDVAQGDVSLTVEEALEKFDIGSRAHVRMESLSAGQQRRVHLAAAFVRKNSDIAIDEPHSSLDENAKSTIDAVLLEQFNAGRSLIVATHDPDRLLAHATHHIDMVSGCATMKTLKGEQ